MGRILVIRGGALGDFVLTFPVLAALRLQFPGADLEVLGYPHIARLALAGCLADAAHPIEARALAGFFARNGALDGATSEFFAGFSVILSYLYDPDRIFRDNVAHCSRAQFIAGPHRPDERAGRHAVETFLGPLESLAIFNAEPRPMLAPEVRKPGFGRWLAAHPGSGSETKNWPEWRWAELLKRLVAESDWNVLLVGGEAEGDRLQRLARGIPQNRLKVARSLPLDEVAGWLRGCNLFLGHDSGTTHLAAAVGLPCLVLWGPSNAAVWRPRGDRILLIQDDAGLPGLETDSVWEILRQQMMASPVPTSLPVNG